MIALCSLTPLKRDINYRHMSYLPAPDLKNIKNKKNKKNINVFSSCWLTSSHSHSANFHVSHIRHSFLFLIATNWLLLRLNMSQIIYTGQSLEPLEPPFSPHQALHLCVALVFASMCLIRDRSTIVNKCCQMWKDHCLTWFHLGPCTQRWMKPGSGFGKEMERRWGTLTRMTHWTSLQCKWSDIFGVTELIQ